MFVISVAVYMVLSLSRASLIFWIFHTSVTNMHNYVCHRVLRATILFFDSNPIGRIVTRFSKDVGVLDFLVPILMIFISQGVFRTFTVAVTVGIINPYLFIFIAISLAMMVYALKQGSRTMQESQKMDGVLRGPIHTTFATVIQGLVTLRQFNKLSYFKQDFNHTLEKCANATFCYNSANRWLGVRLDLVCVFFTVATTAIAFLQKGKVNSELLIVSLQVVVDVIAFFSVSLRMLAEYENFMTSSQRLFHYTTLP